MPLGPIGTRRPKKPADYHISISLPAGLAERLDAWRNQQFICPSRNALIRQIIINFLDQEERSVNDRRHDP